MAADLDPAHDLPELVYPARELANPPAVVKPASPCHGSFRRDRDPPGAAATVVLGDPGLASTVSRYLRSPRRCARGRLPRTTSPTTCPFLI